MDFQWDDYLPDAMVIPHFLPSMRYNPCKLAIPAFEMGGSMADESRNFPLVSVLPVPRFHDN
jgi:hypothetical protein